MWSRSCRDLIGVLGGISLFLQGTAGSADPETPLPEPLTLEYALSLAGDSHPDLEYQRALIDQSYAERDVIEADNGLDVRLGAALRAIEPSDIAYDQSSNDSNLELRLNKVLYDFGRTRHRLEGNDHDRAGRLWQFVEIRQQKHLEILSNYLDVLLADLAYIRDNEFMTMAFLHWDSQRGSKRHPGGNSSSRGGLPGIEARVEPGSSTSGNASSSRCV